MNRYLNVGLMQFAITQDPKESLKKIEENVRILCRDRIRPEIILGPEMGLGNKSDEAIPGDITEALGEIAKEHNVYLLAGSMGEKEEVDGKVRRYNTVPIIGPDGKLIDKYRKMCPYYPSENTIEPGNRYVVLDIKEKNVKIGVMNCHDWCFPEISRNLTLMGADILFRPAVDPEGLYESFKYVPSVRALENQAYFISLNTVAKDQGIDAYGHTIVANPEGRIIYEAGGRETNYCITLDIDMVRKYREYGTFFTEQLLRQVKLFNIPMPYANRWGDAPIYASLPDGDTTMEKRFDHLKKIGFNRELGSTKLYE